jgi:tetratricopeptide (TPR) repeat protein
MKLAALALTAAAALAVPAALGADATQLGVGYICGAEQTLRHPGALPEVMLTGVGNGAYPADTANKQAQAWFDEGLNLYHAFNHNEARDAFAKAAALDPGCALCEWGVALGLGGTLNYGVSADEAAEALSHAERAAKLVKPGDARAKGLIDAMVVRYAKSGGGERPFAKAMDELARRYPADDLVAGVAAEALMIPGRGSDMAAVARAEEILKGMLARRPDDTAAIHYYIHATEFAGHPAEALPYARRLAGLAPGASHLVHMAAHTLMHVGDYEEVALVDAQALKVDADVEAKLHYAGPLSAQMYYLHNYSFGLAGALMAGDAPLALKYADHAEVAFPASFDKGAIATPAGISNNQTPADRRITAQARGLVALGRDAPARALTLADSPGDKLILRVYRHYARGEAYAARNDAAGVRREAEAVGGLQAEAQKAGESGTTDIAAIAADVLTGRAALLAQEPDKAAEAFARAVARQERAFPVNRAFDPPPWWYPVRRSLAYADLAAGKAADAAREARASLKDWPDDALALRVLAQAEAKLGDAPAARDHLAQARKAWHGDLAKVPLALS